MDKTKISLLARKVILSLFPNKKWVFLVIAGICFIALCLAYAMGWDNVVSVIKEALEWSFTTYDSFSAIFILCSFSSYVILRKWHSASGKDF